MCAALNRVSRNVSSFVGKVHETDKQRFSCPPNKKYTFIFILCPTVGIALIIDFDPDSLCEGVDCDVCVVNEKTGTAWRLSAQ